jgi:hypothetical protein
MRPLVPNTPIKRFEYVARTYGDRYPDRTTRAT